MRVSSCCFMMATCPKACSFIEVCVQRVGENCAAFARASLLQADGEYHTTMFGQRAPAALIAESVGTALLGACYVTAEKHLMNLQDGFPLPCYSHLFPRVCFLPALSFFSRATSSPHSQPLSLTASLQALFSTVPPLFFILHQTHLLL